MSRTVPNSLQEKAFITSATLNRVMGELRTKTVVVLSGYMGTRTFTNTEPGENPPSLRGLVVNLGPRDTGEHQASDNHRRNMMLFDEIRGMGYSATLVDGIWTELLENGKPNPKGEPTSEKSVLVFSVDENAPDQKTITDMADLAARYLQDAIFIAPAGGNEGYLLGTSIPEVWRFFDWDEYPGAGILLNVGPLRIQQPPQRFRTEMRGKRFAAGYSENVDENTPDSEINPEIVPLTPEEEAKLREPNRPRTPEEKAANRDARIERRAKSRLNDMDALEQSAYIARNVAKKLMI